MLLSRLPVIACCVLAGGAWLGVPAWGCLHGPKHKRIFLCLDQIGFTGSSDWLPVQNKIGSYRPTGGPQLRAQAERSNKTRTAVHVFVTFPQPALDSHGRAVLTCLNRRQSCILKRAAIL